MFDGLREHWEPLRPWIADTIGLVLTLVTAVLFVFLMWAAIG